jgi:CheY-like chemotaxis protein
MLVDDNPDDNFFHERVIKKSNLVNNVVIKTTGVDALEHLKSKKDINNHPNLIFLDINMPGMNGWEFLEKYNTIDKELQCEVVIIMLTTSDNPDDEARSLKNVTDFKTKPLTKEMLNEIIKKHF